MASHCKKCLLPRNEGEWYPSIKTYCKECWKVKVKKNRESKAEYYREFDRKRAMLPHRVEARKEYQRTEAGKRAMLKCRHRYISQNPGKRAAHNAVNNAVRDGKLHKPDICEDCNKPNEIIHGHHEDYSKHLEVIWLCPACHKARHQHMDGDRWLETGNPGIKQ